MSRVTQLAVTVGLMAVLLSACGIQAKPQAGTPHLAKHSNYYAVLDDPRKVHLKCLRSAGLKFHKYRTAKEKFPAIQIGHLPTGPTIVFTPTPGDAQAAQIMGQAQGAEAIGSALVYPNRASDSEMAVVANCTSIDVSG